MSDEYEPDVFEETVGVNLFGAYRMANATRDLLRASTIDGGASYAAAGPHGLDWQYLGFTDPTHGVGLALPSSLTNQ